MIQQDNKDTLARGKRFAEAHLAECAAELLEMSKTSILREGKGTGAHATKH